MEEKNELTKQASAIEADKHLPKDIRILEADEESASSTEGKPWGYMFIHNSTVRVFEKEMEVYNEKNSQSPVPCFVHRSFRYRQKNENGGVKKELKPTISGLVFLQGETKTLQAFLREEYPQFHLVNDRCKGEPASIEDKVMQPFMAVLKETPDRVTFLREPFEKFAKDHVKLRVRTGICKGCEGYIVRIDRDRQLVFNFGGYAVAIRGMRNEDFEVVEGQ